MPFETICHSIKDKRYNLKMPPDKTTTTDILYGDKFDSLL